MGNFNVTSFDLRNAVSEIRDEIRLQRRLHLKDMEKGCLKVYKEFNEKAVVAEQLETVCKEMDRYPDTKHLADWLRKYIIQKYLKNE
jgi:hypothetical protein